MKDRVFAAADVDEAVALAAANLGLPRSELRFVVLDPGTAGGRGLKPTPARIAVLVEDAPRRPERPAPRGEEEIEPAVDPRAGVLATIRAVAQAGGLDVEAGIEEEEGLVLVRLLGPDTAFFLEPEGRGDVLHAAEHLLQRLYGEALRPRTLRLTCEGYRERRDEALAEEARRVAAAVREDGRPRTLAPQNAYERRVVHLALRDEPGVATHSVGEGPERRVTVAPAGRAEAPDAGGQ